MPMILSSPTPKPTAHNAHKRLYKPRSGGIRIFQRIVSGSKYWSLAGVKNAQGKRFRPTFKTRDEAEIWARNYQKNLERIGREGMNLPAAVLAEAAECYKQLNASGYTLRQATKAFLGEIERKQKDNQSKTLDVCIGIWMNAKRAERAAKRGSISSDRTIRLYKSRARTISASLGQLPIATVQKNHLQNFLEQLQRAGLSSVTRNSYRALLFDFFNYCYCNEWRHDNPVVKLQSPSRKIGDVVVLTPEEVERLLESAEVDQYAGLVVPVIALGAFAGLRPEEAQQIRWEDIDLGLREPILNVRKEISKTRDTRDVSLGDTAVSWLKKYRRAGGVVAGNSAQRFRLAWERVRIRAGWHPTLKSRLNAEKEGATIRPWPADCLRHSFASHWLPVHNDRPKLAELMGNSVGVIKTYYRKLVKPELAKKYWKILPVTGFLEAPREPENNVKPKENHASKVAKHLS